MKEESKHLPRAFPIKLVALWPGDVLYNSASNKNFIIPHHLHPFRTGSEEVRKNPHLKMILIAFGTLLAFHLRYEVRTFFPDQTERGHK